jgi:hypothetical protein
MAICADTTGSREGLKEEDITGENKGTGIKGSRALM